MIDFTEDVGRMSWVRIQSGADRRTGITARVQPSVDNRDIDGRDRDQAGLIQVSAFEVSEVKGAIPNKRAAEASSVLRLSQRQYLIRQRVSRVEPAVAKVAVKIAVDSVCAALCDRVDVAAKRTAELCLCAGSDDLNLID